MIVKTPYGIKPYGEENYPENIGPSPYLAKEQYIFVYIDARGMFMSEGKMLQMTPHLPIKSDSTYVDESSDTYDVVEWLLKHTHNNGKAGLWGISYRGYYAAAGIIDAHPAIVCSSPQAPIADWYIGDDIHHNGAFSLMPAFDFFEAVGQTHNTTFREWPPIKDFPIKDAYNFFLGIGRLDEIDDNYFNGEVPFWDSIVKHPNYDTYWQRRNILPHLINIKPAVLVTGGLFDSENLYGSVQTYKAIAENSENDTRLVLGPWIHGGWARTTGDHLGMLDFGSPTSDFYQREIELPFFNHYLKQKGSLEKIPRVAIFTTGSNEWKFFEEWPPDNLDLQKLYLRENKSLSFTTSSQSGFQYDEYIADPEHPVPYTQVFHPVRLFYNKEYIVEDQRFAASRPDVLSYETDVLKDTLHMLGPIIARLFIAASSSDYDIVVKLIDVYPDTINTQYYSEPTVELAGYQQMVRAEILRVKYRNSFEDPDPIIPGKIEEIKLTLNDVCHAFLPGHKIMIQIQSSWFPLYDRNPHVFMNIYQAEESDFQEATIKIYRSKDYPSKIIFKTL
ncbi:Cocaine esterase [subsurface metagenome]